MARAPKAPPKNPVLDEHLPVFDKYMKKWRRLLNLKDWWIVRKDKREKKNLAAIVSVEHEHKQVVYAIGMDFGSTEVNNHSLEDVACHEMLHVLLRPLIDEAIHQGDYNEAVDDREHSIINVLCDLLMDSYGDQKALKAALVNKEPEPAPVLTPGHAPAERVPNPGKPE
jgi:hypothetical protein